MADTTEKRTLDIDAIADHVAILEGDRQAGNDDAETAIAGMREVALFRAANAQGCLGNYTRPLLDEVVRLRAALALVRVKRALPDEVARIINEALGVSGGHDPGCPHCQDGEAPTPAGDVT